MAVFRCLEQQKMKNGRYLFLATKNGHYGMFSVDPVTKEFARFVTLPADPFDTTLSIIPPLVDTARNLAYLIGAKTAGTRTYLCCYTVNCGTGNFVTIPDRLDSLAEGNYISGIGLSVLNDGRILMSGGTTSNDYYTNFNPVNKTKIITPEITPTHVGKTGTRPAGRSTLYSVKLTRSHLSLSCPQSGMVTVQLVTASGRRAERTFKATASAGIPVRFALELSSLPSGVYFCVVKGPAGSATCRLPAIR
jgi:hypothetical protein